MDKTQISNEDIEKYLQGNDPQKYIVSVEAPYYQNIASMVINDPIKGKYIEQVTYKPFLWLKHEMSKIMYDGNRSKISQAMKEYGVTISELTTKDSNGYIPDRLENGYKYIAKCNSSYTNLLNFFKNGGVDVYSNEHRQYFMAISPTEQFFIQTGKRLFKGFDDYNDLHRLQFDLETTGLKPSTSSIFQIGIKDNRGFEKVLEVSGDNEFELRESERLIIFEFFEIIDSLKPDVISGYNSENFDWDFFFVRCDKLGISITEASTTLNDSKIVRKAARVKYGGESEDYEQTYMWGYNIIDIMHSVRRAMAINSDIKEYGLKYITKFSKIAKPNRVYVPGNKIHSTWADIKNEYYFNEDNGDWFVYDESNQRNIDKINGEYHSYIKVSGSFIVHRYLLDDLWETEKIDERFNQATFLLGKIIPTTYMRSSTMGTAGIWKLIMMGWSYENNLGIPALQSQETFTGGLSRLLEVGYAKNVAKLDYAALYPNIELTHDIFPDIDISGVMKGMLLYIAETRDVYKAIKGEHSKKSETLKDRYSLLSDSCDEYLKLKKEYEIEKGLEDKFDKKQLPLKILANSFFGSFGAPHLFPWGDIVCAEETTCRGRQYLRLMVSHFYKKHNFRPLVGDTDGFNFAIPDSVESISYYVTGSHRLTEHNKGKTLTGLKAVVAEFNEVYMIGRMGLDIDDICNSTINFARKNYANDIDGKIKLVGNTIKSKKMPTYIEEFLDKGCKLLLENKGKEFIDLYQNTVERIANYEIPLVKIASKAKVKISKEAYIKKMKTKNKNGNMASKQAHMELMLKHDLDLNLGDVIYYVNIGDLKSHGDIKTVKEANGNVRVDMMCKLISAEEIERNPDLTTDGYNAPKYLSAFNKRITPLLVCFEPEIRELILMDLIKDKKTKELDLTEKHYFTDKQCELISGKPFDFDDQDSYDDLMTMEDKEIVFWINVKKTPNNMLEEEWLKIIDDYHERMRIARINGINNDIKMFNKTIKRLEYHNLISIRDIGVLPKELDFIELDPIIENGNVKEINIISKEWGVHLGIFSDLFLYEDIAKERSEYYFEKAKEKCVEVNFEKITLVHYYEWLFFKLEINTTYTKLKRDKSLNLLQYLENVENDFFNNLKETPPKLFIGDSLEILNEENDLDETTIVNEIDKEDLYHEEKNDDIEDDYEFNLF